MMFFLRFHLFLLLSLIPSLVSAHGFVGSVTIDGKAYQGNTPNGASNPSVIRQISDIGPVKGALNPDINCGLSAQLATQVASANPGSNIQFHWVGGSTGGNNWPHTTGPMLTYLTSCGSTTCDKYNSSTSKWFKINQIGLKNDGTTAWFQADVAQGTPVSVNLPSNIAPGNYIIRHEIISLQLAVSLGGAEFYPSCTQLTIGGNGNGAPTDSELVTLPGAYSDNDPGIFDPDVYNPGAPYTFPGPPVAAIAGGSSNSSSGSGTPSPSSTASVPGSSGSASSATSNPNSSPSPKGVCQLKRRPVSSSGSTTTAAITNVNANLPRHISRIMRALDFRRSNMH